MMWTQSDGSQIDIDNMTGDHVRNALKMVLRNFPGLCWNLRELPDPREVYVVCCGYDYEGVYPVKFFTNRAQADAFVASCYAYKEQRPNDPDPQAKDYLDLLKVFLDALTTYRANAPIPGEADCDNYIVVSLPWVVSL